MNEKLSVRRHIGRVSILMLASFVASNGLLAWADADSAGRSIKPILPGVKYFSKTELAPRRALRPNHPPGLMPDRELVTNRRELSPQRLGDWERFQKAVSGEWTISWDAFTGGAGSIIGGPGPDLGSDVPAGARRVLMQNSSLFGIESPGVLGSPEITRRPEATFLSFPLEINGVPISNYRIGVVVDRQNRLLSIAGSFPTSLSVAGQPRLNPADALGAVIGRLPHTYGLGRAVPADFASGDFSRPRRLEIRADYILPQGAIPGGYIANAWAVDGELLRPVWVVALGIDADNSSVEGTIDAAGGLLVASRWLSSDTHENINVYDENPEIDGTIRVRQINDGDKHGTSGPLDGNWTNATNGQVTRIPNAPYNHTTDPNNPTVDKNFDEQNAFQIGGRLNRYYVALEGDNVIGARNYTTDDIELLSHVRADENGDGVVDDDNTAGSYSGGILDRISCGHGTYHTDSNADGTRDNAFGFRDSALETDFWSHEYTHRVSGDITAWASTPAAGGMNEGVSDFFASSFTNNKYQGDFFDPEDEVGDDSGLVCCFNGFIRSAENARTYSDVCDNFFVNPTGSTCRPSPDDNLCCEVHSDGEIYLATLWDTRKLFINAEGFNRGVARSEQVTYEHLYGLGSAGTEDFIKGRDQMLAADTSLYGGVHECLIWKAFAGREIGQGANNALPVPTTSTTLPSQCQNLAEVGFNQGSYNCGSGQKGRVLITDTNGGTVTTVTVTTDSGDSETFSLTWSGATSAQTALFDIVVGGGATPGNGIVNVSGAGDTIRASFNDNSPTRTVTAGADVDCHIDVRLKSWRFEKGSCDGDDFFLDTNETATLVVVLQNLETKGTLEGAQLTLTTNSGKVTVNSPQTQIVHDVPGGGDVELRWSLTANGTVTAKENVTFTLASGGGSAYSGGMTSFQWYDTMESDLVETVRSKTWTFGTAPPNKPAGAPYVNESCQNVNLGPDDWCTTTNGAPPAGTETYRWYDVQCSGGGGKRPYPSPDAGYWVQGTSSSTACNQWGPLYNINDSSWLISPFVRIQPPGARFPSRLENIQWKENIELGPEAATAMFIQTDFAYKDGQLEQVSNALGEDDGTVDDTPYNNMTGGWRDHPDEDADATLGIRLIQSGKFGSLMDQQNGRVAFRFLFLGKNSVLPDPPANTANDGYYVDDVIFKWIEKTVSNDADVTCDARDSKLLYSSLEIDDSNPAEGNGNGRADPGETLVLRPRLLGALNDSARTIAGTLTSNMPSFVTIVDGAATYPDIVPGESERPDSPYFKVMLSASIPCGSVVDMTLSLNHNGVNGKSVVHFPLRVGVFAASGSSAIRTDFEANDGGWVRNAGATDTATDGLWEWVDIRRVCYGEFSTPTTLPDCVNNKTTQPGNDDQPGTPTGKAWVTENGAANQAFNLGDVDSGETSITSGNYNLSGVTDPVISYARHYYSREGFAVDSLDFEVSTDGGTNWNTIERYAPGKYGILNDQDGTIGDVDDGPLNGGWNTVTFNLRDKGLVPTATTKFRAKVRDLAAEGLVGQIVEAGLDDIDIRENIGGTCQAFGNLPGEAARVNPDRMKVTSFNKITGDITITYGPACLATDHTIVRGVLTHANIAGYVWSGQTCNVGTSGTTMFNPGAGSFFWVIVGNNGVKEGSYGTNSSSAQRPEASGLPGCNYPQDLTGSCP